jgi:hypothetical protein
MPRGSKPGERRGGRQRGTPNKKTLIKNAVFLAAAADPNRSPLDFMLALTRDPQVPLDLRIDMAAAAAPFVHAKPKVSPRVRTNPMDSSPLKGVPDCAAQNQEDRLTAAEQASDGGQDLSPLKFLIGVMNDSEAPPKLRIRAARIAARYKHFHVQPNKMAAVDEYGFTISRTLAKAIADDWLRLRVAPKTAKDEREASEIRVRQAKRDEFLQCPPGYSVEQDLQRRSELLGKRRKAWKALTMAEETELAYVVARITASEAAFYRTPEGRAHRRLQALDSVRAAGRANTEAEEKER